MVDAKNQDGDEYLYQPHIHSKWVRALYRIKLVTGLPMTVLVNQAVRELANNYETSSDLPEEPETETSPDETWEEICEYRKLSDEWDTELFENSKDIKIPVTILTCLQIDPILSLVLDPILGGRSLAKKYNVSTNTIMSVRRNKTWKAKP